MLGVRALIQHGEPRVQDNSYRDLDRSYFTQLESFALWEFTNIRPEVASMAGNHGSHGSHPIHLHPVCSPS